MVRNSRPLVSGGVLWGGPSGVCSCGLAACVRACPAGSCGWGTGGVPEFESRRGNAKGAGLTTRPLDVSGRARLGRVRLRLVELGDASGESARARQGIPCADNLTLTGTQGGTSTSGTVYMLYDRWIA